MIAYLKVKLKSLSAETRIIRHEERKFLGSSRWQRKNEPATNIYAPGGSYFTWAGLRGHRLDLRQEQRSAYLAYGYLRGVPYRRIEREGSATPDVNRIGQLVSKFGPQKASTDAIKAWLEVPAPQAAAA